MAWEPLILPIPCIQTQIKHPMKFKPSFLNWKSQSERALLATAIVISLSPAARADYASEVLSDNPIMYYRFNDSVSTDDLSPPEINLGSLGAPGNGVLSDTVVRQAPGALAGSADVSMNVAGTGMTVPYTAALNNQGSFSAEIWLKPSSDDIPALQSPYSSWRENTDTFGREGWLIYQGAAANGFNFRTYNKNGGATAVSINSGPGIVAGAWHHVVVTWNQSTSIGKIYVNGILKATSAAVAPGGVNNNTYDANTSGTYSVGARSGGAFGWTGGVDEPAYYAGTVLSDAQVLAHYNNGTNPTPPQTYQSLILADNPTGYWRMNDTFVPRTPPVAANQGSLGAAANGGYYAGSKNTATGPAPASGFAGFGANNSCVSLATGNGYVGTAVSALNNRSAFTVMGWVNRGAVHSIRGGYFGQNDVLEFGDATNGADIEVYNGVAGSLVTPYPFADDAWGFIAYVADGNQVKLYLNGNLISSAAAVTTNYGSSAFNFNIGGGGIFGPTGDFFRGQVDEVAVFDRALTPGRVKQLHDAALGNVPPDFANYVPTVTPTGDITEGQPYTLSVDPTGTPPFTYQWRLNGVDIAGANSQTYTVPAAAANPSGPLVPYTYTVVVNNATNQPITSDFVDVYVTPVLKWTSADPGNPGKWDLGVTQNWKTFTTGNPVTYTNDYAVRFDDSANGTAVALVNDVAPPAIVFENVTKDYTFTGLQFVTAAFNTSTLTKNGAGSVEFANELLDYNVTVNAGVFRVGNGTIGNLGFNRAVTVTGGDFQINLKPGGIYETASTIKGGRISYVGSGNLSTAATIGGAGDAYFDRTGQVSVDGPFTVGGAVTIHSGTVVFDGNQQANRLAVNKLVTVDPGATMEIRGVNALPTNVNSVSPTLTQATLRVVSGESTATGTGGTSHAHLLNIGLNASSVLLNYAGAGGSYNGESFQLNGDITVSGSGASLISTGAGGNAGNTGIAISGNKAHTFAIADVAAGPDLVIIAEIENSDASAVDSTAASLVKTGLGTLRLAGAINHTFTGTLQVDQGTLEADGTHAGPLKIGPSGTISPGLTVGKFTAGATTLAGTYNCDLDGAASDQIMVNGDLVLQAGATVNFAVLAGGANAPFYEIVKSTGTITGPLPTATVPPGYSLQSISSSLVLIKSGISTQPKIMLTAGTGSTDFNANGGGYSASSPAPVTSEAAWTYTEGSWRSNGQSSGFGADNTAWLLSPIYTIAQAGAVTLTFAHRYSFEIDYDGGALDVSVNGAAFTRVPSVSFSQNPYNGSLGAVDDSLANSEAFVGNSAGHPAFITSIATLANVNAGDTVQVRFISASDNNTSGNLTPQGWEIDSVSVSGGQPSLATLTWPVGVMQYSDNLQPPWTDIQGTSPLLIDTKLAPKRFFRLKP